MILPISASLVAGIIGMSHRNQLVLVILNYLRTWIFTSCISQEEREGGKVGRREREKGLERFLRIGLQVGEAGSWGLKEAADGAARD
jgi:hypothetical protein